MWRFHCPGLGLIPALGTEILLQAAAHCGRLTSIQSRLTIPLTSNTWLPNSVAFTSTVFWHSALFSTLGTLHLCTLFSDCSLLAYPSSSHPQVLFRCPSSGQRWFANPFIPPHLPFSVVLTSVESICFHWHPASLELAFVQCLPDNDPAGLTASPWVASATLLESQALSAGHHLSNNPSPALPSVSYVYLASTECSDTELRIRQAEVSS